MARHEPYARSRCASAPVSSSCHASRHSSRQTIGSRAKNLKALGGADCEDVGAPLQAAFCAGLARVGRGMDRRTHLHDSVNRMMARRPPCLQTTLTKRSGCWPGSPGAPRLHCATIGAGEPTHAQPPGCGASCLVLAHQRSFPAPYPRSECHSNGGLQGGAGSATHPPVCSSIFGESTGSPQNLPSRQGQGGTDRTPLSHHETQSEMTTAPMRAHTQ